MAVVVMMVVVACVIVLGQTVDSGGQGGCDVFFHSRRTQSDTMMTTSETKAMMTKIWLGDGNDFDKRYRR